LSDAFWKFSLVQSLETSVASSPVFNVYLAAQVRIGDKGFLSKNIKVNDLIDHHGDIHHIFPKNYLQKKGLSRKDYNQIANYVLMQSEIDVRIRDQAPVVYFSELKEQANNGGLKYGGIENMTELLENLKANCIPADIFVMDIEDYPDFLKKRRILMAQRIRDYYFSL